MSDNSKNTMAKGKATKAIRKVVADVTADVMASAGDIPDHWGEQQILWYVVDVIREKGMFKADDLVERRQYIRDRKAFNLN